jgi:RNA polymerase-binding protein DksA
MNQQQIKQTLLARKDELLDRHNRIARKTRHREEPLPQDFAEQAVELENQELLEALDVEVAEELRQISRALQRIDAGEYTSCTTCGADIPAARLEALPTTGLCVGCATEAERR